MILWALGNKNLGDEIERAAQAYWRRSEGRAANLVIVPPGMRQEIEAGLKGRMLKVREARWCLRGHILVGEDD